MQNVYGKLLEKIVARKIVEYLEDENILPDTHAGVQGNERAYILASNTHTAILRISRAEIMREITVMTVCEWMTQ